jgi:K+/H+ antiporter YhaU regulatory subunit KhtT
MMLMLVGNAGIITVIASIFATLVDPADSKEWFSRGLLLVIGLAGLWTAVQSRWLDRQLSRVISRMLSRWTDLNVRDYAGLLHIGGDYQIMEIRVDEDDWMAGQTLAELKLRDEGVVVLGIQAPDGKYMGVPTGKSRLDAGDVMVVYGRGEQLKKLDRRRRGVTGSLEHQDRLVEQKQAEQTEQNEFEESKHAQKR